MPTMPKLPSFELPKLPFDLPSFDLPTFDLPTFDLESIDLESLELPALPELPTLEQVAEAARDAAYIGLGLAVMTVEHVQATTAKLVELVSNGVEQVRAAAATN